jgi:hypothetical protein
MTCRSSSRQNMVSPYSINIQTDINWDFPYILIPIEFSRLFACCDEQIAASGLLLPLRVYIAYLSSAMSLAIFSDRISYLSLKLKPYAYLRQSDETTSLRRIGKRSLKMFTFSIKSLSLLYCLSYGFRVFAIRHAIRIFGCRTVVWIFSLFTVASHHPESTRKV